MRVEMPIKPLIQRGCGHRSRGWDRARGGSREPWNLPGPSQSNPFWDSMILPPFPGKCPEDGPSWLMQNLAPLASDLGCRAGGALNPLIPEGTPWAEASQGSARLWEAQRSHEIPWREGTESGSSRPLSAMSRHGNPGLAGDRAGKGPVFPITGTAFPEQLSRGSRVENRVTWGDWRWQRAGAEGRSEITESPGLGETLRIIPSSTTKGGKAGAGAGHLPGLQDPPSLALAALSRDGREGSGRARVLMWELCPTEICLLCKTQGKRAGARAAAFPAQGRDAGGSEGSGLRRL